MPPFEPKPGRAYRPRRGSDLAKIIKEQDDIQKAKDLEAQKKRAKDPEYEPPDKERELKRKRDRDR